MSHASRPRPKFKLRSPAGIVLLYVLFSMLWIAVSDHVLILLVRSPEAIESVSRIKGFLFIAVTGAALYMLLRSWHRSMTRAGYKAGQYRDKLERALQGSNDGWWDWDLRKDLLYYSPRWWEMLGYAVDELPADSSLWRRLMRADDLPRAEAVLQASLADGATSTYALETHLRHKQGHYVPLLTRYRVQRDADGKAIRLSGTNMDLSEHKQAEERLRQAATVFETTREGVMVTNSAGCITMVNHAFTEISGYSEAEVLGKPPSILGSGHHDAQFYHAMWQSLADTGYWRGEIWNRRKNGEIYPELLSIGAVRDGGGAILNYVGVFADISKLKDSENKLNFLAHHDPLTQLPNRLKLMAALEHCVKTAQREQTGFALLMLDLDRFKDVNDSFGHAAGDELLRQVAVGLRGQLREMDMVARLGGDEFVVLLEKSTHPEDAGRIANDIIGWINKPWQLSNGVEVHIGVSIGISIYPEHGGGTEALLQHADAALYQAKQEGRGCFRYFSEKLTRAARERIHLEARLHQALSLGQLRVHYQAQLDIADGRIIGAEALVRWQDPDEGLIAPERFIPVAETTGMIGEIGHWVLTQTCRQGQAWIAAGLAPMTLAVNLSPRQFLHGDICALVEGALAETGFPAERLTLELTEGALMECGDEAVQILKRLRRLGVRLAIDDFGTGYSSLACLKHFPLDVLKIDRSFISDIPFQPDDMAIAAAIVTMGHTLGFKVLAEGVETNAQLAFLKAQGCDLYQGYLASRPLPADAFERLLAPAADPLDA
ncbi:putative bifunctional diguanylate cyclase/phosphodiesterase [Janthinobacterium fluminis]|uniref:EAL domain-containing protein n=1 Tax=Janthinobacterium fluminis TaxID=2987524 RepID=A0ABT5JY22_9BURK|nr:EAL domain-containing protein [Janthinobacterium fluminis]MDC8757469.1 EAL domain-containing protein [Janthinobacterium fluminis]